MKRQLAITQVTNGYVVQYHTWYDKDEGPGPTETERGYEAITYNLGDIISGAATFFRDLKVPCGSCRLWDKDA